MREELLLPSFLFLEQSGPIVGVLAQRKGLEIPGRLVSSAKSWLSHAGIDRTAQILPPTALEGIAKVSPVDASREYLRHLRVAWDAKHPELPFAQHQVLVTVPASFDAVARDLTQKAAEEAGYRNIVLLEEPQAAFYAWIERNPDWREQVGVGDLIVVIDIGGGTTDLIVFNDDNVRHTASIGLGGRNVTNDLAIGIRTPLERAEEIKRSHGTCLRAVTDGEYIPVPGVGGREEREVSRAVLASIIEPRMREIFTLALRELQKNHYLDTLGAGIVLTGGCARLHGAAELAEQVFGMPVKVGVPKGVGGLVDAVASPAHATGVGLVRYGAARLANGRDEDLGSDRMRGLFKKMSEWVRQYV